ncbi:MAG TPA: hypothetical protein PK530_13695 [Anaerolineales bacterium]|nr:hypothetical protein [Anaerolineales bacterium]
MHKAKNLSLLFVGLLGLFLTACSNLGPDAPRPTLVFDEVCQKIIETSFQSSVTYPLGEGDNGVIFGPHIISFKADGSVYWRYSLEYVVGTFECNDGAITAHFSEGDKEAFEGSYIDATALLEVDNVYFSKAPSE